ncbi:Hypothetical predicted protein [Podarcis lilfordi]|uniref:Uncharacterized protein n=1 Tax=Podarcis lilfordi TaxID=74358 RepID=A0AA35LMW5_9SAUR|nr:Hypothetical predicted protein [Podarcis lilfordi]
MFETWGVSVLGLPLPAVSALLPANGLFSKPWRMGPFISPLSPLQMLLKFCPKTSWKRASRPQGRKNQRRDSFLSLALSKAERPRCNLEFSRCRNLRSSWFQDGIRSLGCRSLLSLLFRDYFNDLYLDMHTYFRVQASEDGMRSS